MVLKRKSLHFCTNSECNLNRPVKLVCKDDNTACITAVEKGYSTAVRDLKRHAELSLGFTDETFYPDRSEGTPRYWTQLTYWNTKLHKGD